MLGRASGTGDEPTRFEHREATSSSAQSPAPCTQIHRFHDLVWAPSFTDGFGKRFWVKDAKPEGQAMIVCGLGFAPSEIFYPPSFTDRIRIHASKRRKPVRIRSRLFSPMEIPRPPTYNSVTIGISHPSMMQP